MDDRQPQAEPTAQEQLEANPELVAQMERTATDPAARARRVRPTRQ